MDDLNSRVAKIIDELSKMPPMVIATAYLHAINYTLYGEDVTEKWLTSTQNAIAFEKAYRKGYHDAMEKLKLKLAQADMRLPSAQPRKKGKWIQKSNIYGVAYWSECDYELHTNNTNFCPNCGALMKGEEDE